MPIFHVKIEVDGKPRQFLLKTKSQVADALKAIAASRVASLPVEVSPEADAYDAELNDWAWSVPSKMRLYSQNVSQPWITKTR